MKFENEFIQFLLSNLKSGLGYYLSLEAILFRLFFHSELCPTTLGKVAKVFFPIFIKDVSESYIHRFFEQHFYYISKMIYIKNTRIVFLLPIVYSF